MTWTAMNEFHHDVISEIETQTDRAAALIAASFLEDRLEELIKTKFVEDNNLLSRMFKGYGPLASFSAKIDISVLMGLNDEAIAEMLRVIKNIRNDFAHDIRPIDFNTQKIRDKVNSIPDIETPKINIFGDERDAWSENLIEQILDGQKKGPRQKYMSAVKFIIFLYALQIAADRARKLKPIKS